jgi:hypothetical protein
MQCNILGQAEPAVRSVSSRILTLTTHLTAMVLLVGYSGFLISYLTFRTTELPFTSFQHFLQAGTYRLGVLHNSIHYTYFKVQFSVFYGFSVSSLQHGHTVTNTVWCIHIVACKGLA